mmetsp:Transcript_25248/g.45712  ORF Transcript_25248/g.45712 Transcript_25248/m.45712 type:complete len:174 (-) Transcript_25248:257-778(-)
MVSSSTGSRTTVRTRMMMVASLYCLVSSVQGLAMPPMADPSSARAINNAEDFRGGAGVGRMILDDDYASWECKYDMVLVERIQGKAKKESGLFVPDDNLPKLHLCKVISIGPGREEENGLISPMPDIQPGDVVVAKNPWGIGPKDEETTDGKKLSFMRGQDIAAKIDGKLLAE